MATSNNSSVTLIARGNIRPNTIAIGGGKGGVSNYELLTHKPSINGHELIGNKTNADLGIPTDTQDLTNTAGFITKLVDDLVNYYTKLEIDDIINQIKQSSFRIVDDLPLIGDPGVIYLILNSTPQSRNYYDEYIYIDSRWEKIGTTEIDLSGYVTDDELTQVLRSYITNEALNEALRNYYNKADVNLLLADKANSADLAAVATSGSYNDLSNKPAIPDELADLGEDSTHRVVTDAEKQAWNNKSDFSGSYNDLIDKPTLGTASSYDVPESGNAGTSQVVKGNDSRLSDARTPLSHTHSKADITDFPTNISAFNNDSGFITNTVNNLANYYLKTQTYTQTEVDNLISAAVNGRFQKVNELPASGEPNVIYLVPKATPETSNACDEYIWQDNAWELIGSTEIDLSDYVTDDDLTTALQSYLTTSAFNTAIASYYTKTETDNLLANKVDKVAGKGLSTNDYDNTAKGIVDGVTSALNDKVDKVQGKGLSTNDYDNTAKGIVDGVTSALDGKVDKVNGKGLSTEDYTAAEKSKLGDISNNAKKVASSSTNGHIEIDDVDTTVYDDIAVQTAIDNIEDELSTDYATVEGNPINFSTLSAQKSKSTILSVEPIQDLHGYDKPWVGGAGKNKFDVSQHSSDFSLSNTILSNANTDSKTAFQLWVQQFNNGTKVSNLIELSPKGTPEIFSAYFTITGDITHLRIKHNGTTRDLIIAEIPFTKTGTYCISMNLLACNPSVVNGLQIKDIQIEEGSTATSYEPYENICPISGRTEIGILGCGKNLATTQIYKQDYVIASNGSENASAGYCITDKIFIDNTKDYYLTFTKQNPSDPDPVRVGCYDKNGEFLERKGYVTSNSKITFSEQTSFIRLSYANSSSQQSYTYDIQLEENSATPYSLYTKSNDLTISFGQTVYGCHYSVENGVLVVDRIRTTINDLSFFEDGDGRYRADVSNAKSFLTTEKSTILCSHFETTTQSGHTSLCISGLSWTNSFMIWSSDVGSVANLKSTYGDAQICYELIDSAKTTINLTPHTINLLKGVNNISTDGDKITLTYRNGVFATLEPVSEDNDGLMSRLDKVKLDSIADDATKTESSTTNGNIKINGTETQVYDDSEIKGELTTDTTTIEGNPLNFSLLSAQNAKSTILSLEPIQDLHGYDKPWVGGAGKNILPMTLNNIKSINTDGTWNGNVYSIYSGTVEILTDSDNNVLGIKPSGTFTSSLIFELCGTFTLQSGSYILNGCPSGGGGGLYRITCISNEGNLYDTGSGAEVSLEDSRTYTSISVTIWANVSITGKVFYPMIRLSTETDATFEPYTNICPISGRSEIGILGCGKNEIVSIESGSTDEYANKTSVYNRARTSNMMRLKKGKYTLECETSESDVTLQVAYHLWANYGYGNNTRTYDSGWLSCEKRTLTFNTDVNLTCIFRYSTNVSIDATKLSAQLCGINTDITISLGQTVYGGTLDVENGVLVVDRKRTNLGSLTWTQTSGGIGRFQSELIGDAKIPSASSEKANCVCSVFESDCTDNVYTTNGKIGIHTNGMVWVSATNIYSDAATFTTAMDGVDFVYELATPITINLTPHTINLLKGVNNISTDGDKITLTYRDGSVATLGDLTSAVDNLDSKIEDSKILTDTVTGDKYILVVTNGVLSVEQISN